MRKQQFPWVLLGVLAFGLAAGHVLGLVLAALGSAVVYFSSLRLHPRMRHGRCKGTGEHRGAVFKWVHRRCPGCQGGRIIRWGAGQWGAPHVRAEYAKGKAARAKAKAEHRWR